ncbi:MAG: DUF4294 domain-containing protein [Bacteroidetes bacterium]|nr:MAG: DUF4294 domain-containing protein [Bacteroidota bacterium]
MGMKHFTLFFTLLFTTLPGLHAQEPDSLPKTVPGRIIDGDTVPFVEVKSIYVYPPYEFKSNRQRVRYSRLVYNIQKVYPYAKLAGENLEAFRKVMDTIATDKERRQYARQAEQELEDRFGDEIRDLTFSQGKILIKLIYRQTGNSSFEIVRELRGKFSAFIWQTLASLFGYDLKTGYDPEGEDRQIEEIILLINQGYF